MNTDQNFPIITYSLNATSFENGLIHGESFKEGIRELSQIRRNLLIEKNPDLEKHLENLSDHQLKITQNFSTDLYDELRGISQGSGVSLQDLVILNNYTDFRDINLNDEGCSTIQVIGKDFSISGQTWDMHRSAKNYVCLINIPGNDEVPGQLYFSLVGCLGMMGISSKGLLVGVNNLNTKNAHASLIWPALIRKSLSQSTTYSELVKCISSAPVTSGHNYLISSKSNGSMWEISPKVVEKVSEIDTCKPDGDFIFHTNHCIGEKISKFENKTSISSTTHDRYNILLKNASKIQSSNDMENLLHGHENFPKSICGHFENNSQDPSSTCGGGYINFLENDIYFWRGCSEYDKNFKSFRFKLNNNSFQKVS